MAGLVSSHSKCFKAQLVIPPGSAAWLPCSAVPGARPQPTCSQPKCGWPWSSRFHQELCSLLFLIPTSGSGPEQSVARVKVWGRAGPCQCLLGRNTVKENSGGWRSSKSYRELFLGMCLMAHQSLTSGEPDDITNLSSLSQALYSRGALLSLVT